MYLKSDVLILKKATIMSILARIFVITNLVLTVIFFGSSATLYLNREPWREKYVASRKDFKEQIDKVQGVFERQKSQLNKISEDNARLSTNEANLVTANKKQNLTIEQLKREVDEKEKLVETHLEALTESQKTLQEKEKAISDKDSLINQLRDAEQKARGAQEKAISDVTRVVLDFSKLNDEHSQLLVAHTEAQDELEKNAIIFEFAAQHGIDLTKFEVPFIDGYVEAVNDKDQLVVLSVGKDQKTEEGYNMFVHRGGEYIGKLKVIKVYDDLSGARVVYTVPGKSVKVGDRVKTTQF